MPSTTSNGTKTSPAARTSKKPAASSRRTQSQVDHLDHVVRAVPTHMFVVDTDLVVTNVSDLRSKPWVTRATRSWAR